MDTVFIDGLEIETIIGIYDWEREVKQVVRLDLQMAWDNKPAAQSEDINKALNYAFTILNLHKVYLHVAVNNDKAIYLYEACGFVEEGHLIKEIFVNGQYCDVKRMYLLQDDYLSRKK